MFKPLAQTVVAFPRYAALWVTGLAIAILSDIYVTALAVTGVVGGLVFHSVLVGVFIFFVAYSLSRVIGNLADSVGYGARGIAASIRYHADDTR
jgi:hypothetical protein